MESTESRRAEIQPRKAFATVEFGRQSVSIYRRRTPAGRDNFMVSNYSSGKRRFDSYPTEADAQEAALKLAKQLAKRQVVAASMTNTQAADYAAAMESLAPFEIPLSAAVASLAAMLKRAGNLATINEAVTFFLSRRKQITPKAVPDVVTELLEVKKMRGASMAYQQDLKSRLNRFAGDCKKHASAVTTADLQAWLDAQGFSAQGYTDFRSRIHQLFKFAIARGYASDNPVDGLERLKVKRGPLRFTAPKKYQSF